MIKQNSMLAYIGIQQNGKAKSMRGKVYQAIFHNPGMTRAELANNTSISINSICGRVRELLDCGAITEGESKECSITGNTAATLNVVRPRDFKSTTIIRRPRIKELEAQLKIATDALSSLSEEWHPAEDVQRISAEALTKIGGSK